MTDILIEKVTNKNGVTWVRTHGLDQEGSAFCSPGLHSDIEGVSIDTGQITCPDCISFIKFCKAIPSSDLLPEYENPLFSKRFKK
ncbi:MAG: hypothetical protein GY705_14905 [Bacteroidetes bacterium]|nr:hypothetical protein [Bacteroidota bacterium]